MKHYSDISKKTPEEFMDGHYLINELVSVYRRGYAHGRESMSNNQLDLYNYQLQQGQAQQNYLAMEEIRLKDNTIYAKLEEVRAKKEALLLETEGKNQRVQIHETGANFRAGISSEVANNKIKSNERIELRKLDIEEQKLLLEFEEKNMGGMSTNEVTEKVEKKESTKLDAKLLANADNLHTYITGGTGGGKSEVIKAIVHHHLRSYDKCVVVIDSKDGELAEQIARFKDIGKELIYINPKMEIDGKLKWKKRIPIINVFDIDKNILERDEGNIVIMIRESFELVLDSKLGVLQTPFVEACIKLTLHHPYGSFSTMLDILTGKDDTDKKLFSARYKELLSEFDYNYLIPDCKDQLKKIIARVQGLLNNDDFKRVTTGKNKINIFEAISKGKLLIFNISEVSNNKLLGSLIIAMVQSVGMSNRLKENNNNSTYLVIDEFQDLITPSIKTILSKGRSYRLNLILAHQDAQQVAQPALLNSIHGNSHFKIVLRQTDKATVNKTKELLDVTSKQLGSLEPTKGECFIRIKGNETLLVVNSDKLVDYNYSISDKEWITLQLKQIKKHYTKIKQVKSKSGQEKKENHSKLSDLFDDA
jgi:hypothetical protein